MEIKIVKSEQEAGQLAKEIFAETLKTGNEVFGLATGSTPVTTYEALAESDLDFSNAIAINLDEYFGLSANHPQSYAYFMHEHLFQYKPFKETYIPNGANIDSTTECARYDAILAKHPRDLQLLGIGTNAHIGFNEPGSAFDTTTQLVDLTPDTIEANKRFFESEEDVPHQAYSMGIKSIMDAKHVLIMAFGKQKAEAIRALVEGPVTNDAPASVLQNHDHVTVIIDEDAASLLSK